MMPSAMLARNNQVRQAIFLAMGTSLTILGCGKRFNEAVTAAHFQTQRLEQLWSTFRPNSQISKLNADPSNSHALDADTVEILRQASEYRKLTAGTFDVCLGTQIDLGGIAKGFAVQRIIEILRSYNVESALVNFGQSSIGVLGVPVSGNSWKIGIRTPDAPKSSKKILPLAISLNSGFISTSGNYEANSAKGNHIRDPRTGLAADSSLHSVTVICEDACLAEALSTAIMVGGAKFGAKLFQRSGEFEAVIVDETGEISCTPGLAKTPK